MTTGNRTGEDEVGADDPVRKPSTVAKEIAACCMDVEAAEEIARIIDRVREKS